LSCAASKRACAPGRLRRALLALLGGLLLSLGSPAAAAALPPQGVYEQCGPASHGESKCLDRLSQIRAGGFEAVLNYTQWYATAEQLQAYADRAHELGLKLIWPLNAKAWRDGTDLKSYYRYLGPDCPCSDNDGFMRWVIGLVKDHPATWGYYVGDEVDPAEHDRVKALSDRVKALDPAHPHIYVSFENTGTLGNNLRPFADVADVLAADSYPIAYESLETVGPVAEQVQAIADQSGRASGMVLQAFSWTQYPQVQLPGRWPTRTEMVRMRDLALAYSRPSLLLWYSYFDVQRSDDPAGHWADLRAAAFAGPPPDTAIVTGPAATSAESSATFSFASASASGFECRLDGSAWTACSSPQTYSGLADGPHSFTVRGVASNGQVDPIPASWSWEVALDRAAPLLRVGGSRRQRVLKRRRLTLSVRANEAASVTVAVRRTSTASRFPKVTQTLAPGATRRVRLRVSRSTLRQIRRVLSHRDWMTVTVVVTARDLAGNLRSATRRIRLIR
jgi:hypothetical protein